MYGRMCGIQWNLQKSKISQYRALFQDASGFDLGILALGTGSDMFTRTRRSISVPRLRPQQRVCVM